MTWIYLTLLAQLLIAVAVVIDKFLLSAKPVRPLAYSFGVALLSGAALFLLPFGVSFPPSSYLPIIIATGVAQFLTFVFFFKAVRGHDPSLAAAKTGTFIVFSTFAFSAMFGVESHLPLDLPAVILMTAGMFVLGALGKSILKWTFLAGLFGGLNFALLKVVLDTHGFVDGVFWTRMALVAAGLSVLAVKKWRTAVIASWRHAPRNTGPGLVVSKLLAGAGFLLIYYTIKVGDVVTVSALESVRFAFVLVLALLLEWRLPHGGEESTPHVLLGKIAGILLIISGFLTIIV